MSESSKLSVFDDRIIQTAPQYAVYKGGESITNTVFNAISANTAQHNFNCPVPSPNIFVDRAIDWTSTCALNFTVGIGGGAGIPNTAAAGGIPIVTLGKDIALCAFPLHTMTQTMTATINDVVVSMNTAELLPQLLRMTDYKRNLVQRTCPSMLDTYSNYNDGFGALNSPLNSYYESIIGNYCTNGAYSRVQFADPNTGLALPTVGATAMGSYTFGGVQVWFANGIPHCGNANPATGYNAALAAVPIGLIFTSTEKLVLPPFIFADSKEMSTGLFGINAFQVLMNVISSTGLQRVIRSTTGNFRAVLANSVAFAGSGFSGSKLNVLFITPNLSVPLPPISSVPWLEMPRYTTAVNSLIPAGQIYTIQSNNIVLPCIPDYFMIFAKPQASGYGVNDADWLLPITKINLNFNNYSGLMNNVTQEQLYHVSMQNGLECDWNLYNGKARCAPQAATMNPWRRLCGAPLIVKPGKDFHLSQGLASGVNGNFNIQFSVDVDNSLGGDINTATGILLYLVCINSGFFESQGGSSRIIRAPLSESDVINAPASGAVGKQRLERMVGGGFFDKLSPYINKAVSMYNKTKPLVSAVKNAMPEGKMKSTLKAVGYGKSMSDRIARE